MSDFTAGGIDELPEKARSSGSAEFDDRIRKLVEDWGCENSCELIEEMVLTALKMGQDEIGVADLKLFSRSLKELRYAARVFAPYTASRKVVVFGSARTPATEAAFHAAEAFAGKLREKGYMIITGAGEGIMGAAQRGAGREHSFGLNIRLPFEQKANEVIHGDAKLINFNYFFTRKLNFLKESHAVALFPGGFGTLDEGFEAITLMQTGKARIIPLVLIDEPGGHYWETWMSFIRDYLLKLGLISPDDLHLFKIVADIDAGVEEVEQFYRHFHSYRWVRNRFAMRITKPLKESAIEDLNANFQDLLIGGRIEQRGPLSEEKNEPDLAHLTRLVLTPHRHNFGRLRQLIDAVNAAEPAGTN